MIVPLVMPVTVVQPRFVNRGPKRGSEATERGEGVGRRYRDCFTAWVCVDLHCPVCMKTAFSCILNAIITGGGGGRYEVE